MMIAIASGKGGTGKTTVSAALTTVWKQPVIAMDADIIVLVTEPTPSGLHDMARVTNLCDHFQVPVAMIVNKCDLNPQITEKIETQCLQNGYAVVARLAHDPDFVHAMVQGRAITEFSSGDIADQIKIAWKRIMALANIPDSGYNVRASDSKVPEPRAAEGNHKPDLNRM